MSHPSRMQSLCTTLSTQPLGDMPWQSFMLKYNGDLPDGEVPAPWMETGYNAWYQDPCTLIHNIISNPNFKGEFEYAPYQEYSDDGQHFFQDMMSGDWVWNQAVSSTWFPLWLILYWYNWPGHKLQESLKNRGSMLVPIILGSDKTTVSIATGHNE